MNKIKVTEDTLTKDELDLYKLCSKSGKKRFLVNKYNELYEAEKERIKNRSMERELVRQPNKRALLMLSAMAMGLTSTIK